MQIPMYTLHGSFQLKLTLVSAKYKQLLILSMQIMITGADNQLIKAYFCAVPCTILRYDLKMLLP